MITNNSKRELKLKTSQLEERFNILKKEKDKLQAEIDFINTRMQAIKDTIDDLKADSV